MIKFIFCLFDTSKKDEILIKIAVVWLKTLKTNKKNSKKLKDCRCQNDQLLKTLTIYQKRFLKSGRIFCQIKW